VRNRISHARQNAARLTGDAALGASSNRKVQHHEHSSLVDPHWHALVGMALIPLLFFRAGVAAGDKTIATVTPNGDGTYAVNISGLPTMKDHNAQCNLYWGDTPQTVYVGLVPDQNGNAYTKADPGGVHTQLRVYCWDHVLQRDGNGQALLDPHGTAIYNDSPLIDQTYNLT
jgi:hypothetical protein